MSGGVAAAILIGALALVVVVALVIAWTREASRGDEVANDQDRLHVDEQTPPSRPLDTERRDDTAVSNHPRKEEHL